MAEGNGQWDKEETADSTRASIGARWCSQKVSDAAGASKNHPARRGKGKDWGRIGEAPKASEERRANKAQVPSKQFGKRKKQNSNVKDAKPRSMGHAWS